MTAELPPAAQAVIVGGGVIGVSCAFDLAAAGVDGVALWSPDDTRVTLDSVVLGYAGAARRLGAVPRTGVRVTRMETQAGEIVGVRTDAGRIRTGTVVCTAGRGRRSSGRWLGCSRRSCPSAVAWRRTLARFERNLAA